MSVVVRDIDTPVGPARAHVERARAARGVLVLGHGAGGGIQAPDLVGLRAVVDDGWSYVRIEQPWRVAGKRVAPRPATLDQAWLPIVQSLRSGRSALRGTLVVGGRSAGARVACRTAAKLEADAVLALSFPLHPPGRPESSRAGELDGVCAAGLPLLIVTGERDPFGRPQEVRDAIREANDDAARVVGVPGDHSFTKDPSEVVRAVRDWLAALG